MELSKTSSTHQTESLEIYQKILVFKLLPKEILFSIFSWSTAIDIQCLDSAVTNHSIRKSWKLHFYSVLLPNYQRFRDDKGDLSWGEETKFQLLSNGLLACPLPVNSFNDSSISFWDWQKDSSVNETNVTLSRGCRCYLELTDTNQIACHYRETIEIWSMVLNVDKFSFLRQISMPLTVKDLLSCDDTRQSSSTKSTFERGFVTCILALSDGIHLLVAMNNRLIYVFHRQTGQRIKVFHFSSSQTFTEINQLIELNDHPHSNNNHEKGRSIFFLAFASFSPIQIFQLDSTITKPDTNWLYPCTFEINHTSHISNPEASSVYSFRSLYLSCSNSLISWSNSQIPPSGGTYSYEAHPNYFQCWNLSLQQDASDPRKYQPPQLIGEYGTYHSSRISMMILLENQKQFISVSDKDKGPFLMKIWNIHDDDNCDGRIQISFHKDLIGHENTITSVIELIDHSTFSSFSPTRIVSGSKDLSIRIWNIVSGDCERSFLMNYPVIFLKSLKDGHFLSAVRSPFNTDREIYYGSETFVRIWKRMSFE